MAGGIGDLMGGIGGIASALINSGNQRRANDIAEQNGIMQYMLGSRNIDVQDRLGTKNLNMQQDFGDRNFRLQKTTADRSYALADKTGTQQYDLAKEFGGRNLDLQEKLAAAMMDNAKSSKFDAYGNEVYYDEATKSYKIRLAPDQQRLMDANKLEEYRRSTLDQAQRRRGLDQNEDNRNQASSMLADAIRDYRYGRQPVNEGELTNQLVTDAREQRDSSLKAMREAMVANAVRTNNSGSIQAIGQGIRANGAAAFGSDLADARMKAMTTAQSVNNADQAKKANLVNVFQNLSKYDENPAMGGSPAFAAASQQADAGGNLLAQALRSEGASVGGALQNYGQTVGGAIGGRGQAMISALTGGAAAQGGALTNAASAQGNAINNLMQAMANAYQSTASGVGEAWSQQAKIAANSKVDLGGAFGKLGSGLGGLFASMGGGADDTGAGVTTINKRAF